MIFSHNFQTRHLRSLGVLLSGTSTKTEWTCVKAVMGGFRLSHLLFLFSVSVSGQERALSFVIRRRIIWDIPTKIWLNAKQLKNKDHLKNLCVVVSIILKLIFINRIGIWTGLIWLRMNTNIKILWIQKSYFPFYEIWKALIFWGSGSVSRKCLPDGLSYDSVYNAFSSLSTQRQSIGRGLDRNTVSQFTWTYRQKPRQGQEVARHVFVTHSEIYLHL